jgi:hypothetical protein
LEFPLDYSGICYNPGLKLNNVEFGRMLKRVSGRLGALKELAKIQAFVVNG